MVSGRPASRGARGPSGAGGTRPSADLHHAHVQTGLGGELLAHVARRLGRSVVGALQRLQLLGGNGGARPLGCGLGFCAGQTVRPARPLRLRQPAPRASPQEPRVDLRMPMGPGSQAKAAGGPARFPERGAPADGLCIRNPQRCASLPDTVLDPQILRVCVNQVFMVKDVGLLILSKRATSCFRRCDRYCRLPEQSAQCLGLQVAPPPSTKPIPVPSLQD